MKRLLVCLLLLCAIPAVAQNKPLLSISTGEIAALDSASGATVLDPVFGLQTPFAIRLRVQAAISPVGPWPNVGRMTYYDTAWRALSGDTHGIVTYFGTPFVVDKAAGRAIIQWSCKYTTTLDLATVNLTHDAPIPGLPDTYSLTFSVRSYFNVSETFHVTATIPASTVKFY